MERYTVSGVFGVKTMDKCILRKTNRVEIKCVYGEGWGCLKTGNSKHLRRRETTSSSLKDVTQARRSGTIAQTQSIIIFIQRRESVVLSAHQDVDAILNYAKKIEKFYSHDDSVDEFHKANPCRCSKNYTMYELRLGGGINSMD